MALSGVQTGNNADDELDDILNGITEEGDERDTDGTPKLPDFASRATGNSTGGDGLGIDEEITITKKRIPIPKLDDNRLLSDPGIPRLRKISKERLRFKGKGHEVEIYIFNWGLEAKASLVWRHCAHAEYVSAMA